MPFYLSVLLNGRPVYRLKWYEGQRRVHNFVQVAMLYKVYFLCYSITPSSEPSLYKCIMLVARDEGWRMRYAHGQYAIMDHPNFLCHSKFLVSRTLTRRPVPTVGCRGCDTPRQIFCWQITKFAFSVGIFFYLFVFLDHKKKNQVLQCNGKLFNFFTVIHEIFSCKQIFFKHREHSHFCWQNVDPTTPPISRNGPAYMPFNSRTF